jgi:hypothetical protein
MAMGLSYELYRIKYAFKIGEGFSHLDRRLKSAIFRAKVNLVRHFMRGHTCIIGASFPQGISISGKGFDISEAMSLRPVVALIDCEVDKNRSNGACVSVHGGAEVYVSDTRIDFNGPGMVVRAYP